jgi:hypothetical protein
MDTHYFVTSKRAQKFSKRISDNDQAKPKSMKEEKKSRDLSESTPPQ